MMRNFFARYRDFFRQRDVASLVVVALVARMPVGMLGISMLLYLREALGSYASAGAVSGTYFMAMALGAPIQGRIIDRVGPVPVLRVTGLIHPLGLATVLVAANAGLSAAVVAIAAAAGGAFASPLAVLTRTLWRHRFREESLRHRAFAVDSVIVEINFTLGPAVIAAVVATAGARAGFATAIVANVVAFLAFVASPALRYFRAESPGERHLLGPLREPRLLLVYLATFGLTTGFGLLEVGYPGYATALAMPALGGVLLSVCSFGSALSGAIFGGVTLRAPVERQFAIVLGIMAVPFALHAIAAAPYAFGILAFLTGAAIAPSLTCQSLLVSRLAPAAHATEAFTWSSTCIVSGLGFGMALGGWLVESLGTQAPFLAGAAILASVSAASLALPAARH